MSMSVVKNPIRSGFYPDPSVCRVGDTYYCVHSSFGYAPGIPLFKSTDLIHWEQIGHVLKSKEQLQLNGAATSGGIYAPTIRYHQGTFYVIVTNVTHGGNFYVTCNNPEGTWSEPHILPEAEGIDPSLYFEGDKCYYIGQRSKKEAAYFGDCEIWIQELDYHSHQLVGKSQAIYDGALKKAYWPEGPHLYKKDGYYYLLIAEGGTEYAHSICAARSRELLGPYESCPWNPVFTHRHLGHSYPIQNAGHGELFDTPDGNWYMVMLATRPYQEGAELGRETFLADVTWEEDWPVINAGEGRLRPYQIIQTAGGKKAELTKPIALMKPIESAEDAELRETTEIIEDIQIKEITKRVDNIDKNLYWNPNPDMRIIGLRRNILLEGYKGCRVQNNRLYLPLLQAELWDIHTVPAFLGIRLTDTEFSMSVRMEFSPEATSCEAGLVYYYDENNYIQFIVTKQSVQIICRKNGTDEIAVTVDIIDAEKSIREESSCKKPEKQHTLTITGKKQTASFQYDGRIIADNLSLSYLCSERAGGFTGCTVGIYGATHNKFTEQDFSKYHSQATENFAIFDTIYTNL